MIETVVEKSGPGHNHRRAELQQQETTRVLGDLGAVLGTHRVAVQHQTPLLTALEPIGNRLGVTFRTPDSAVADESVDAIAQASHVRARRVRLTGGWWNTDGGDLLGFVDDKPVALLSRNHGGYELFDPDAGELQRVDRHLAGRVEPEAVTFCRPFAPDVQGLAGLARFILTPQIRAFAGVLMLSVAATLLGMLTAQATALVVDSVIPHANSLLAVHLVTALLVTAIGAAMFQMTQGIVMIRIQSRVTAEAQAAVWDRILNLPAQFFRRFAAGDLFNRAMMVTEVSRETSGTVLRSLVTSLVSTLNIGLLFWYSSRLAWIAVLIGLGWCAVTVPITLAVRRRSLQCERLSGRTFGFVVQLLLGMSRIRVAGAEQRAFNEWGRRFAQQLRLTSDIARLDDLTRTAGFVLPAFSSILLFALAADDFHLGDQTSAGRASMGTFLAFHMAFGLFIQGMTTAGDTLVDLADTAAKTRLIEPILETVPEVDDHRAAPGRLKGRLELRNVTFRYRPDGPRVLQDVSLQADPGEFIALVGASGSGKSTILRLLLGFESAESGLVAIDDHELATLDVCAVRRQMGVVLQSDRINTGSIFDNLTLGCPASLDDAWHVASDVGLAEDIEQMPMGMHSIVNEGGTNLSGGQRQRLLLARALLRDPRILLLDEATSALDNRTQSIVSRSIERRGITRVAIAHRLSTIENADRIFVLDAGRVVQQGTFEDLNRADGPFREFARRQA